MATLEKQPIKSVVMDPVKSLKGEWKKAFGGDSEYRDDALFWNHLSES